MGKADALKKRYIACEVKFAEGPSASEVEIKKGIYNEALRFFGEYLLSFVALKFHAYDPSRHLVVLRCRRNFTYETLGFLALVRSLNGRKARTRARAISGTMKGIERKLARRSALQEKAGH